MPNLIEIAAAVLVAVLWPAWEHFVGWPWFVARARSGAPNARVVPYRATIVTQWVLVGVVGIVAWLVRRPAASLGLVVRPGAGLVVGLAVCAAVVVLLARQV